MYTVWANRVCRPLLSTSYPRDKFMNLGFKRNSQSDKLLYSLGKWWWNWWVYTPGNTVEPLFWDTSIQGIPLLRGHKVWSRKNVHIIFVSVTSFEGTPLFKGKGDNFWVLKSGFNLHSREILALKKWLTTENVEKLKCRGGDTTPMKFYWVFSLEDKTSVPVVFSSCSFISHTFWDKFSDVQLLWLQDMTS